jgi:hypothetical protein
LEDGDATIGVSFGIYRLCVDAGVPYCTIEAAGTEPEPLPNILKEEISLNLSLQSNLFNESDLAVIYTPSIKGNRTHPAY